MKRSELKKLSPSDNPLEEFRIINERGEFVQIENKNPFKHLVYLEILPGHPRGNHYHKNATEWFLIYGGSAKVVWRVYNEKTTHEILVKDTEPALFEVPQNIEHAILNDSKDDIFLISFSTSFERGTVQCTSLFESTERRDK